MLAVALIRTLFLLAEMSLLELLSLKAVALSYLFSPSHKLLFPLRLSLLLLSQIPIMRFKQFMKAYLKAQTPAETATKIDTEPCERLFKAWLPDLYYRNSHIKYYRFCQQCEDHFDTARAKGSNRIPFAASFLHEKALGQWLQYKRQNNGAEPMTWPEFKDFLQTNLGDSKAFMDGIWSKIKRNSQY